jgi:SnoaL-like domain
MSDPDTKTVVRRWVAAWNQGDVEAAVALLSPAYVRHDANLPEVVGTGRREAVHARRTRGVFRP